ncbi:MarR family transcriptional regulator [Streptomyces sp. NPDC027717]|uniref:GbsR/MarR family transcriptional regulator n=1 Tax=unclassified Streptomyces TaxID=2593676 RepID=UPI0033E77FA9
MTEPSVESGDGRDPESVSRFVERFAAQLVEAGVPRMPARVFAALLASDTGTLTSAELGELLRISPAAVSGAVRYLAQVHLVSREREPGSRRERYRVHSDQWYEALTSREAIIKRWEEALREGIAGLGPETPAGRRLTDTLEFFEFIESDLAGIMERWREHRAKRTP